jgi:hypothetical protein
MGAETSMRLLRLVKARVRLDMVNNNKSASGMGRPGGEALGSLTLQYLTAKRNYVFFLCSLRTVVARDLLTDLLFLTFKEPFSEAILVRFAGREECMAADRGCGE